MVRKGMPGRASTAGSGICGAIHGQVVLGSARPSGLGLGWASDSPERGHFSPWFFSPLLLLDWE